MRSRELHVAGIDAQARRRCHARDAAGPRGSCRGSAPPRPAEAAARTLEGQAARAQRVEGSRIVHACAPPAEPCSPSHSKPKCLEGGDDVRGGSRDLARPIQILDAQQPAPAVGACIEIARHGGIQRPEVQFAGRRRGKASDISGAGPAARCGAARAAVRREAAGRERHVRPAAGVRPGGVASLPVSVVAVAVLLFAALAPLLRFHRERCDRPRFEALDADFLAGLQTIAV